MVHINSRIGSRTWSQESRNLHVRASASKIKNSGAVQQLCARISMSMCSRLCCRPRKLQHNFWVSNGMGPGFEFAYLWLVGNGGMGVIVVIIVPHSSIPYYPKVSLGYRFLDHEKSPAKNSCPTQNPNHLILLTCCSTSRTLLS